MNIILAIGVVAILVYLLERKPKQVDTSKWGDYD